MAYHMKDVVGSVEIVDLTADDSCIGKMNKLAIPDEVEEERVPLIYRGHDDEDDEAEGDDCIRLITPKEQSRIGQREASNDLRSLVRRSYIQETKHLGFTVQKGSDLELVGREFFRVIKLYRDSNSMIQMQGILLVRARLVQNFLPKKMNELCAIVTARTDDGSSLPNVDEHLTIRPLSAVICPRRIIFTNHLFPAHSFREQGVGYESWQAVEEQAELVCRYKYIEFCDQVTRKVPSQALVRLRKHECYIGITDAQLMLEWRKLVDLTRIPHQPKDSKKRKVVDLTSDESDVEEVTSRCDETVKRVNRFGVDEKRRVGTITERFTSSQSASRSSSTETRHARIPMLRPSPATKTEEYTFGDICAGAGGATSAARRGGLNISFALDHAKDPYQSLLLNFEVEGAKVLHMDIFDLCNPKFELKAYMRVDVLHMSFPCQPYSTAHTHAGKDDERNEAAGYSVIPLLNKCRPRVVTFEQSPNIMKQHRESFEALIHQITDIGYSVRWKIVDFADYGNVQSRNRLWMFAACPGEPLPAFPEPTHGIGRGLLPYTTVNDVLRKVPRDLASHMAQFVVKRNTTNMMPYNGDRPLKGAITCNGGENNVHPSGLRPFNCQELAQLQGFSKNHEFSGNKSSIMRQIGNAVPGKAATPFFKEIVKSLKAFDEEVSTAQQTIEID